MRADLLRTSISLENRTRELDCYKQMYTLAKENEASPTFLCKILFDGYEAAKVGYIVCNRIDPKGQFKELFNNVARNFAKLAGYVCLPYELATWKRKQNLERWVESRHVFCNACNSWKSMVEEVRKILFDDEEEDTKQVVETQAINNTVPDQPRRSKRLSSLARIDYDERKPAKISRKK